MALSAAAEEAFHAAIEAAYAMEDAVKLWGREDRRSLLAYETYEARMQKYYELTHNYRERFWSRICSKEPWLPNCRLYDV